MTASAWEACSRGARVSAEAKKLLAAAFTKVTAGSATFYDLTRPEEVATPRPCAPGPDNGLYAVWELFYGV